jgi:tRNA pseudouridine55 synthase
MIQGLLLINKPKGKTSFYLVGKLRRILGEKTIGHAGTLDPFATGVMVLMIGKPFTKMSDQFLGQQKEYVAKALLGVKTDTFDLEGAPTQISSLVPSEQEVINCIAKYQGLILQMPPMYSAKKVNGKKLYDLARKGIEIERKPCPVEVSTELISYNYPYLEFKVSCSKGTYIRSIADDMGKDMGCFAHLIELTRTKSGPFFIENCLDFEKFEANGFDPSLLQANENGIISFDEKIRFYPS